MYFSNWQLVTKYLKIRFKIGSYLSCQFCLLSTSSLQLVAFFMLEVSFNVNDLANNHTKMICLKMVMYKD